MQRVLHRYHAGSGRMASVYAETSDITQAAVCPWDTWCPFVTESRMFEYDLAIALGEARESATTRGDNGVDEQVIQAALPRE